MININHKSVISLYRFILVGLLMNLCYFLLYLGFVSINLSVFLAAIFSYFLVLPVTYLMSSRWTFDTKNKSLFGKGLIYFLLVYLSGGLIMAAITGLLAGMGIDYKISWFFGACYAVAHNFLLSKYIVFSGEH